MLEPCSTLQVMKSSFLSVISIILIGCEGATHHLAKGSFTENETYKVNSYYGCCGCQARYFMIEARKKKVEQVVYSYNCPAGGGAPTKFTFIYNKNGKLLSCERYVATTGDDFTMPLSEHERKLFFAVDTNDVTQKTYTSINFSKIKGFRKPTDKEVVHPFPLIKKGYKLSIQ